MKNIRNVVIYAILIIVLVCSMTGCTKKENISKSEESTEIEENTTTEEIEEIGSEVDDSTRDTKIQIALENMTLQEKIGQLLIVNLELLDDNSECIKITKTMKEKIKNYSVGGVIFFARNIDNPKQTKQFIQSLQKTSKIPMFISVDEEGGEISRIGNNPKMKTTKFPSMAEIGKTGDENKAFEVGDTIGKEIKELGFNLDFAPIADLETNPDSPEIGKRAFSAEPEIAAKMVAKVVEGLQGQNVSATLKHFPGHGSAKDDTHKGYADIEQSIKQLREVEFVPFQAGIEAGVDLIMVSHLTICNVTGGKTPASLSSLMITEILRNELGYQKLIITDALNMKAITKFYSSGEAAVMALNAGADLLLMPENLEEAFDSIYQAVLEKKLDEKRIDESLARILKVKLERGVIKEDDPLFVKQQEK